MNLAQSSLSNAHDQRPPIVHSRVVIHVTPVDKPDGFAHVRQCPGKSFRNLVRRNIVTTLENACLDALDRQFRGTDVQVIEKHSKPAGLGLTDQIDLRRMREHGFRNETPSLFEEFSAPLGCHPRGLIRVPWVHRQTARALDFISVYERKLREPPLKIRLELTVVERGLPTAVDTHNQMKDGRIWIAHVETSLPLSS